MGIVNSIIEFILLAFIGIGGFVTMGATYEQLGKYLEKKDFIKKLKGWKHTLILYILPLYVTAQIVGIVFYLIFTPLIMLLNFIGLDIDLYSWFD